MMKKAYEVCKALALPPFIQTELVFLKEYIMVMAPLAAVFFCVEFGVVLMRLCDWCCNTLLLFVWKLLVKYLPGTCTRLSI